MSYKIYTPSGIATAPPEGKAVVALGIFDGVHAAHRTLLRSALSLGKSLGAELVGAWCFGDSPASLLGGEEIPQLCTLEDKVNTLLSLGLDFVAVGDFKSLRSLSACDFIHRVLMKELHCIGAACGFNHRFGYMGQGTPEMLAEAFGRDAVAVLPEVKLFSETVSSSAIRALIADGQVGRAQLMLGRPFSLKAPVLTGKRLGRSLGFPTANQYFPAGTVTPAHGIYATVCTTEDGKRYVGVSNVGIRPTITDGSDRHEPNCETYIHGFSGNLYGRALKVEFYEFLRPEMKFRSTEELKAQIEKDLASALTYFEGLDSPAL
ncbi:MAG: riboflavin biosynthesis protein RibF [Clostridia bacterium]|nr:riboflavin biosynthesis protein RibF [Clostridia bacterium]